MNSWLSTALALCSSSQCAGPVVVLKAPARDHGQISWKVIKNPKHRSFYFLCLDLSLSHQGSCTVLFTAIGAHGIQVLITRFHDAHGNFKFKVAADIELV